MNPMKRMIRATFAVFGATASLTLPAIAANWYVSPNGTGGGTSPSDRGDAMSVLYNGQVASGDTIHFTIGTYSLDVSKLPNSDYGAYLRVPDGIANLTLVGETGDPDEVRLVGNPAHKKRILYFPLGGNVVRDMTLANGYTDYQGAGICMADSLIGNPEAAFCASNCVVENCSAGYQGGGGFGGLWRDCVIRNNEVRNKGSYPEGSAGGVFHATLYDCVITNNVAGFCGGGIAGGRQNGATSGMTICETKAYNCLIGWNRSVYGGGAAIAPENCTRDYCQLFGCTLVENAAAYDATGDGGGLGGGAYQCVVSNCVVRGNSATRNNDAAFNAYGHNYGVGKGGGVMDCEVIDSTLENNTCTGGGAGASNSDLAGCVLQGNSATGGSPAYANYGGGAYTCSLTNCLLAGNSAGYGGGACNGYLENCVISNNTTTAYDGGAAYKANTRNCIVVGNQAHRWYALCAGTHYGDLVFANSNGNLDYWGNNWGNSAIAIGADSDGEAVAVNCTVWWNTNGSADISRTALTNCIVQSVGDIPSAVNSFWVYENGTIANQTGCISGADKDPKFEGLGVLETVTAATPPAAFTLQAGSPCRDTGRTLAGQRNETDILGNKRVKNDIVDMGALECLVELAFTIVVR